MMASSEHTLSTEQLTESFKDIFNSLDDGCGITVNELAKEEQIIAEKNKIEDEKIITEFKEAMTIHEQQSQKRHEKLMNLLTKSQFYADFISQSLQEDQKKSTKITPKRSMKQSSLSKENEQNVRKTKKLRTRSFGKSLDNVPTEHIEIEKEEEVLSSSPSTQGSQEEMNELVHTLPKLFENGKLRPYQMEGYIWLKTLFENCVNGILADEMGLGKTVQAITLICHLVEMNVTGPFLVIAPLSTLCNWILEFQRFAPKIPLLLYHGSEQVRKEKRKEFLFGKKIKGVSSLIFPVVITSYEVIIKDKPILKNIFWRYVIVDEGHRLKNHKCRLTRSLNTFKESARLVLTGTPLQNNLAELWSLLNYLIPEIFDSLEVFESWFNIEDMMDEGSKERIVQQEREKQIVTTLHKILEPFLLRRLKTDVELEIPPKQELLVYTPMTALQIKLYAATLKRDMSVFKGSQTEESKILLDEKGRPIRKSKRKVDYSAFFNKSTSEEAFEEFLKAAIAKELKEEEKERRTSVDNFKLQNSMMQLRKIVNHPYLVSYPLDEEGDYKIDNDILKVCGKLQVLDQLLKELHGRGHKVLVFSQMTKMLDVIEDYLSLRPEFAYKRLDGSCKLEDRSRDIKAFNEDKNIFLFLLSTRAGGLGINLSSADTVIIYDSDWNPQQDLQAQDRCHRIGQTNPVLVLRLVTTSTIDQRIVERASTKRRLEKIIIKTGKFKNKSEKDKVEVINPEDLLELLNQTYHQGVHETSSDNVFSKNQLDSLLDRSALAHSDDDKSSSRKGLAGVFKIIEPEMN